MRKPLQVTKPVLWMSALLVVVALACNMPRPTTPAPPTATPEPGHCRDYQGVPIPPQPTDPVGFQTTIASFLSNGGSAETLRLALQQWGAVDSSRTYIAVDDQHDLDQDGLIDVLVAMQYPNALAAPQRPGQLLFFGCDGANQAFRVKYGFASSPESGQSMPYVHTIEDITNDGIPEVVFYTEQCTAIACFREPFILSWDGRANDMVNLGAEFEQMYTYTDENGVPMRGLPGAGIELVRASVTTDHLKNVVIIEAPMTQRAAGPHRPMRYTWTWHGDRFTFYSLEPAGDSTPPNQMIHALRDADRLVRGLDLEEAVKGYRGVAYEGELVDPNGTDGNPANDSVTFPVLNTWGGIFDRAENHTFEDAMLRMYARYRLVMVYTAQRDLDSARLMLNEMNDLHPYREDDIASYYTLLAQTFSSKFTEVSLSSTMENALSQSCQQVRSMAGEAGLTRTYEYLGDPDYFGPSLANYSLEDLCPF